MDTLGHIFEIQSMDELYYFNNPENKIMTFFAFQGSKTKMKHVPDLYIQEMKVK